MSISYFNQNSSGNSGTYVYVPKVLRNPYMTAYNTNSNINRTPVFRSGVGNNLFDFPSSSVVGLYVYGGSFVSTDVSSYVTVSLIGNMQVFPKCYVPADQCVYILLRDNTSPIQYRLIKMSDSTGVVSAVGAAFTPTTAGNWNSLTSYSMSLDTATGHLKLNSGGVYHLINKSTGAIVSQDNAFAINGINVPIGAYYTTLDNTVSCATISPWRYISNVDSNILPAVTPRGLFYPSSYTSAPPTISSTYPMSSASTSGAYCIDDTKIVLVNTSFNAHAFYLRTEFDKYIKSLYETFQGE